mgnify:CR=1 FL=1
MLRSAADDIVPLALIADAPDVERDPAAVIDPAALADISSNAVRSAADAFDPIDCRSAAPTVDLSAALVCDPVEPIAVAPTAVRRPLAVIVAAALMSAKPLRLT